ncbi:hypothetical protein PVAND_011119 [Polypedilum vanderplanki]|uniref:PID domain-containing protein n=1 Tax=Polypedilum vanderplanki TaxID=319348 RepID=A0A9J6CIC5_POLVA|nr:hypothetical protein PVAND_011119 [Polypedilum vanderplanki]
MSESTPICRCRVLYLGSAVPRQSKDGLQGIQEPLRSLYPMEGAGENLKGIDSWLSVWSNGILLENVDENRKQVTRFFPIESLHYCAAVRQVLIPERNNSHPPEPKFLPLDSPFARAPRAQHPPIFAAILRRTTGIKVLECHTFICKREAAANALVRCCFHAYADNSYAKQVENGSVYGTLGGKSTMTNGNGEMTNGWRSRAGSTTTLNSMGRHNQTNGNGTSNGIDDSFTVKNMYASSADLDVTDDGESSLYNGDENHKVWTGSHEQLNGINGHHNGDNHYDFYSNGINGTSTIGRPSRQRQIAVPVPAPPPPKEEFKQHKKKESKKSSSKSVGSQSLSGTLIRPRPIHPGSRGPPPHLMMYGPPHPPPPHGPPMLGPPMSPAAIAQMNGRQFHTIGHHRGHLPPPQMMHMPPMPMMVPQQYATLQSLKNKKKNKKDKMNAIPVAMPIVPPMFYAPPPAPNSMMADSPRALGMNRKLAQSTAALDDSGNSGAESPSGTGIYRRKGHLNERAFSYSIRQEHRSRSHGSLASLQFSPPDMKKEREIIQMVSALDINGDESTLRRNREMSATNGNANSFGKPRR